jgi:hypothetical protein
MISRPRAGAGTPTWLLTWNLAGRSSTADDLLKEFDVQGRVTINAREESDEPQAVATRPVAGASLPAKFRFHSALRAGLGFLRP